ncbi:MAG: hypothetical protein IJ689_04550 [Alphaproteobacteria bacterium]|nr:hypothetical protein [Alphaproteobacteria bacterium]
MTINKTFLIFLLAGVSYTAYNAAAVSERFEISTTIDHEIVLGNFKASAIDSHLSVNRNISLGTIYINSTWSGGSFSISYYNSGTYLSGSPSTSYVTVSGGSIGTFLTSESILSCSSASTSCNGFSLNGGRIYNIFGGSNNSNYCDFVMSFGGYAYTYPANNAMKVYPRNCIINDFSKITTGDHSGTLTISYTS